MNILRKTVANVYLKMRDYKWTFNIIMRLKELGINRFVKSITGLYRNAAPHFDSVAFNFFEENAARIDNMLNLLEDYKSRKVWKAAVESRIHGTPIPNNLWSDTDQYFVKDIIHFSSDEVFIDGGAFIGDTISHLLHKAHSIKRIVAFEPEPENLKKLKKYFGKNPKIVIIEKGLSDTGGVVHFSVEGSGSAIVENDTSNTITVPVISIDNVDCCRDATFIKMDIEGAEMAALRGGAKTILTNKPKLAICIYHSNEDMIGIAEYIHELVPEYKLYVRQHQGDFGETVLYAVV